MTSEPVEDWRALYDEAFERFHLRALWSYTRGDDPTPEIAMAIGRALRRQGDLEAWRLGARLERACRAA